MTGPIGPRRFPALLLKRSQKTPAGPRAAKGRAGDAATSPSLPAQYSPTGKGYRPNTPLNLASNNGSDVRPDSHHPQVPGGTVVNVTHDLGGGGHVSSLQGSDPSVLASYKPKLGSRSALPSSQYQGAPGTKAEKFKGGQWYKRLLPTTHSAGPGSNHVTLSGYKASYAYVNEKQDGKGHGSAAPGGSPRHALKDEDQQRTLAGNAELSYTSVAAQLENRHQTRAGETTYSLSAEGPAVKLSAEGEARLNRTKGKEALALHARTEASVSALKLSGQVEHTSPHEHFAVGLQAFGDAGASSVQEASLVIDREAGTYMGRAASSNIASVQGGAGASVRAGPFQVDVTAAKMVGVGYAANVAGGVKDKVVSGMIDLRGAAGPGGRVRVGVSVDGARLEDSTRNLHNKLTNAHYSQEVRDRSRLPSLAERERFQKQVFAENRFAEQMNTPENIAALRANQARTAEENRLSAQLNGYAPGRTKADTAARQSALDARIAEDNKK